jgi:hypothetical protein
VVVRPLKKWKPLRNTYWSLTTTSELEGLSESIFYTCTFVQFFFSYLRFSDYFFP